MGLAEISRIANFRFSFEVLVHAAEEKFSVLLLAGILRTFMHTCAQTRAHTHTRMRPHTRCFCATFIVPPLWHGNSTVCWSNTSAQHVFIGDRFHAAAILVEVSPIMANS